MRLKLRYSCIKLILTSFLFLLISNTQAQEKYFFEKLSVSDGLSNSVVLCTYQDHLGFQWIGTLDGLNRYDGYDIKVYKSIKGDSTSLVRNEINAIAEDGDGNLWVGSIDGVSKYNRGTDNFTNYLIDKGPGLITSNVNNLFRDSKDRLWSSTQTSGVQLFDKSENKFRGINYRDYSGNEISYMAEEYVWNVVELKNGNILIASPKHGIFIYNVSQNQFQPYFANPKLNIKDIYDIFEDSSGKLWLTADDEIYIYNPLRYELKSLNITARLPKRLQNNNYLDIYEEASNKIYICSTLGIIETDLNADKLSLITESIPNLNANRLYRDNFGIYWISSGGNGLIRFDPAKKPFQFFEISRDGQSETKTNPVLAVAQNPGKKDELFLSLENQGIYSFNRESLKFNKILNQSATFLLPAEDGNLWYSQDSSINLLDLKSGKVQNFPIQNPEYSREYFISRIKFGPDNNIWIADRQGIKTFNPLDKTFKRFPSIMTKSLEPELLSGVRAIANNEKPLASLIKVGEGAAVSKEFTLEKESKILIVTLGEGRQNRLKQNMFDYGWLDDSNGKSLWSSDRVPNTFYAGGGFKNRLGLACLNLPTGSYKINFLTDIGHSYGAFNVTAPPDSDWYGIQVFELDDQQYSYFSEKIKSASDNSHYPLFEHVSDIVFSRKYINTAWFATFGAGLTRFNMWDSTSKQYRFDDGTQTFALENRLEQILEDKDGILWISSSAGLIMFDPETEEFHLITQNDDLASNQVLFITEDQNSNLWFGTPGGLSMLDNQNKNSQLNFINFDNKDGINSLPLNESMAMTEDGEIFYGGYGGLNAFYPGSANSTLPKPVITSLNVSGVPVEKLASKLNLKTNISEASLIELPFIDNNLSFEFASIHYSRPAKNKLAYMLEGIDKNWNYTNKRFASYINLPPGEFVFRLKGSNGDGVWNPKEAAIQIIINPPWWRTTVAYIFYVLLFAGIIFSFDRFQRKRIHVKEREAAKLNEAELRAQMAEAENERKTKELEEARQLQLSMLPKELPQLPNLDIAVYMQTATEVGGDYYDFHVGLDGTLTVVVGDATGHGMKAGTMVTTAKSLFNSYAPNPDILYSFQEITRCIKQMNFGKLSMCLTMLKIKGDKMQISTAAMPPSLIFRKETKAVEEYLFQAMPLGSMEEFPYELKDTTLSPGDTILLMSDGLPELGNSNGEMYGYKKIRNGFEEVAEKSPEKIISYLKNEGASWVNNADPDDDVTFVVIKVK